jgi:hypothetical protein
MKLKGLDLLEKHVEKIVLAATVVLLAYVGTTQVLTDPNAVRIDNEEVSPDEVDRRLRVAAERLDAQLNSDRAVDLPPVESVENLFRERRDLGIVQSQRAVPWGSRYHIDVTGMEGTTTSPDAVFAEFTPAVLDAPLVHAEVYNIDPLQFEETPELAAEFAPGQPLDMRAVTIETVLDPERLREVLDRGRDDETLHKIPLTWYEDDLYIVDVEVERQQQLKDGSWSEPLRLAALPGRPLIREELNPEVKPPLQDFIQRRNELSLSIERPAFYNVRTNAWRRPSEVESEQVATEEVVDLTPLGRLESQMQRQYQDIEQWENQKASLNEDLKRERANPREGDRGENPRVARLGKQIENLDQQIDEARRRITDLEERAERIDPDWVTPFDRTGQIRDPETGREGESEPDEYFTPGDRGEGTRRPTVESETLLEREEVPLWAHDIHVEPGGVYRYRIRYAVLNPFVDKATRLSEEQRHLAASMAVYSEPSDWSAAVEVPGDTYYFITAANPPRQGTPVARASVKMYRYYDGFWRFAEASLEPGDELAKTISIMVLPGEEESSRGPGGGRPPGRNKSLETVNLELAAPITLLDVVERPIKRQSDLGVQIAEFEAVLAGIDGRIMLRSPHLESADPRINWLEQMVRRGSERLESWEG